MKKMRPVLYIVLLIMVFGTGYYIDPGLRT